MRRNKKEIQLINKATGIGASYIENFEDQIICSYFEGEFEMTKEKWDVILTERQKKGKALVQDELLLLFPRA
ncbi:hypothetical protein KAR91_78425 [Candidatus Pacearchaeota archaeon]|nr:hypothetical protein [Candidatus Pacearchaeota archaeon]